MIELIVLGTIPGTSIQIDFSFWMMIFGLFINIVALTYAYRHRAGLNRWLAGYVLAIAMQAKAKQPRRMA